MKRPLPILVYGLLFVVCGLTPAFAQDFPSDNHLVLPESGKVSILTIQINPPCDGQLYLYQPYEKLISTSLMPPAEKWIEVGYFNTGDELVFKLELNGSSASCTGNILSTNTNFGYLLHTEGSNYWAFVESGYFVMAVWLDPSASGGPPPHPAIFIHGLGGRPEDWTTGDKKVYFDLLKADYGYPEEYLIAYPYADADENPATYDYQGDVMKISADLESYVNALSQKHLADGGDGKVDLVGFSLGGLVARQYLNTHSDNHKIRKAITIASPHEGLSILTPETWVESLPFFGQFIKKAFLSFLNNFLLGLFVNPGSEQPVSFASPAAQQLVPNNPFLQWLNDRGLIPTSLSYSALCGDIDARFRQKVFFFTLEKSASIGDGTVPKESALGIPVDDLTKICFSDEALFDIRVAKIGTGYEYAIDPISFSDVRFRHSELIVQPEVVNEIIGILTAGG